MYRLFCQMVPPSTLKQKTTVHAYFKRHLLFLLLFEKIGGFSDKNKNNDNNSIFISIVLLHKGQLQT